MIPLSDVIAQLRRNFAILPEEKLALVKNHMEEGAKLAKSFIGTEREGWSPLSPATLNGFYSQDAGWIKGKIELGYTGHVSDTDPLLREGALRDSYSGHARAEGTVTEGVIGSSSEISKYQELGTSKIPPRPVSAGAMTETVPNLMRDAADLVARTLSIR